MSFVLSSQEISQRLIRLRNLERLHAAQLKRNKRLLEENQQLKAQVTLLEARDAEKDAAIAMLKLRIEDLERMAFGKQRRRGADPERPAVIRTRDSYRRRIPDDDEITDEQYHSIDTCPDCGTPLSRVHTKVFYEEDIVLPPEAPRKTVTRHAVEHGWCSHCRGWRSAYPLPSASVILGHKIKLYICYLAILIRLSWSSIRALLQTTYDLDVSEGEIAAILQKESRALRPEYEALKEGVRLQPGAHYDETGYPVVARASGNYAWVMTGTETSDAIFDCGKSRGKGVAADLKGKSGQVGITDDYGAYRTLFKKHQLCWAHPTRKLRDLVESQTLGVVAQERCRAVYETWQKLYAELRATLDRPFDEAERVRTRVRLSRRFDTLTAEDAADPPALRKIKAALRRGRDSYFTCLMHEGIPPDNNKAERALRHLVLKRKTSLGSKTERGAEAVSILASVLLSLFWRKPVNFFGELMALRGV
jgi:transposase